MAKREIVLEGKYEFVRAQDFEKGQTMVDGVYVEKRESTFSKPGKEKYDYVFECDDCEKLKLVNGFGQLDKYMEMASPGDRVEIVYCGKEVIKKGEFAGTMAHQVKVLVDDQNEPAF